MATLLHQQFMTVREIASLSLSLSVHFFHRLDLTLQRPSHGTRLTWNWGKNCRFCRIQLLIHWSSPCQDMTRRGIGFRPADWGIIPALISENCGAFHCYGYRRTSFGACSRHPGIQDAGSCQASLLAPLRLSSRGNSAPSCSCCKPRLCTLSTLWQALTVSERCL